MPASVRVLPPGAGVGRLRLREMGRRQGGNGWGVCAVLAVASLVSAVVILGGGGMWDCRRASLGQFGGFAVSSCRSSPIRIMPV